MPTTIDMLARIASDVYKTNEDLGRDNTLTHQRQCGFFVPANSRGFQGCIYDNAEDTIVVFRGTADTGGVTADILLGMRLMPNQLIDANDLYIKALEFHHRKGSNGNIIVVGHSLGGFLAQAVCGMYANAFRKVYGCTFNSAPARRLFSGRLFGYGKSSYQDRGNLRGADEVVLNFMVAWDVVTARFGGKRVGKKIKLKGGGNSFNAHLMGTVKKLIEVSEYRELDLPEALVHRDVIPAPTSGY